MLRWWHQTHNAMGKPIRTLRCRAALIYRGWCRSSYATTYGNTIRSAPPSAASPTNLVNFSKLFSRSKETGAACTAATFTTRVVAILSRDQIPVSRLMDPRGSNPTCKSNGLYAPQVRGNKSSQHHVLKFSYWARGSMWFTPLSRTSMRDEPWLLYQPMAAYIWYKIRCDTIPTYIPSTSRCMSYNGYKSSPMHVGNVIMVFGQWWAVNGQWSQ